MASPKYSLLLPVRNERERVRKVLEAAFADLGPDVRDGDWEILVGDDFSDDGTREILSDLSRFHPFRLVAPEKNLGRGPIRNLLAREARGQVLVFMDGDCLPLPGFFRAWEGLEAGVAYVGKVEYERAPASGFSRFLAEGSGVAKLKDPAKVPAAYFITQNLRIPKAEFLRAGGFREDLKGWGGEDTDFGYKLAALKVPLRYNPKAAVRHPSVTSFEGYLDRLRSFGRVNLPVLLRDHPALRRQFKLHLARFPWSLVFLNPAADRACRGLLRAIPGAPWPFALYRYAVFNGYARGWRESGSP